MAWTATGDGKLRCDAHGDVFAAGRSCPACAEQPALAVVDRPGPRESLHLTALADGLPSRVQAEAMLYADRKQLEATAIEIERHATAAIDEGDRKTAAALYSAAVRYRVEAGKHLRHAISMVTHRERAAEVERFDRLHMSGAGQALAASSDGSGN